MKNFTYLLFLAIGVTACSVESIDSTENLLTADLKVTSISAAYEGPGEGAFTNPSGKEFGYVFVTNDCDNIYIEFAPTGTEDIDDVKMGIFINGELPSLNNGENINNWSQFTYNLNNGTDLKWVIPYSETTTSINIFANAWGHWAGDNSHGKINYLTYNIVEVVCDEPVCDSGYMIGDKNFDEIGTSKNWGWAHEFQFDGSGSETREIHHKNGSLNGTITISYENGTVTVEEGEGVTISHMYLSNDEPTLTNAPGQFDKEQNFSDGDGTFWVIIKAEVCN